jgi:ribosomal protein S18 acetylase RimI-like enzyme
VEAIEDGVFRFWSHLGRSPQLGLYDGPDMIRFTSDVASPFCNNILRADLSPDDIDATIETALAPFKSRRVPVRWWITPSTRPANLSKYLEAHGLTLMADVAGMAVDLAALNETLREPSGLTIEQVSDVKTLAEWVPVSTSSFGFPESVGTLFFDVLSSLGFELPWRHYIGRLMGTPVACSSFLLGEGGVAGIYFVGTVPEARGKGIGAALTLAPLLDARAMGYRIGVLGASQMGLPVYRRLGFREYCRFGIYIWNGEMTQAEQNSNGA